MKLDPLLVSDLRTLAATGAQPCQLADMLLERLPGIGRLEAIAYFREAFFLSLADAMCIGAAPAFGEDRDESAVDDMVRPLINATQHCWQPR